MQSINISRNLKRSSLNCSLYADLKNDRIHRDSQGLSEVSPRRTIFKVLQLIVYITGRKDYININSLKVCKENGREKRKVPMQLIIIKM